MAAIIPSPARGCAPLGGYSLALTMPMILPGQHGCHHLLCCPCGPVLAMTLLRRLPGSGHSFRAEFLHLHGWDDPPRIFASRQY
jgi:hypothetical protein